MNEEVWIGLVEIVPKSRKSQTMLGRAKGGFVSVLMCTDSEQTFTDQVAAYMAHRNLRLKELNDVEPLNKRLEEFKVDPELLTLADIAAKDKTIQLGRLFKYRK